jgi:GNAT superfamily N-acetyltransferase
VSYTLSFDPETFDLDAIHGFLTTSYWSPGIPRETVAKAIAHSLSVAALDEQGTLIGFARLVTDRATFAWLADVFVLPPARGQGIAKAMVQALRAHPETQGFRRWLLGTWDAHAIYQAIGWEPLARPDRFLEIHVPDVYQR